MQLLDKPDDDMEPHLQSTLVQSWQQAPNTAGMCWKSTQNMCASPQDSIEVYLEEHLSQQHMRLQKDPPHR